MILRYFLLGQLALIPIWLWILIIWSLIWKGIALWKAGTRKHLVWFIVLFIVNTAGILEILYIFIFADRGEKKQVLKNKTKKRKKR